MVYRLIGMRIEHVVRNMQSRSGVTWSYSRVEGVDNKGREQSWPL